MTTSVNIVSTGARTPIGLASLPAAAALRAQISGVREHPFIVDQVGDPIPGALDALLDPGIMGTERLISMAENALREVCEPLSGEERTSIPRLPVYLGLPEIRPGFTENDAEIVCDGIYQLKGLPIELSAVNIFAEGHAAGLSAFSAATGQIKQGAIEACLVGGVDSYFQPDTIEWLNENRQLFGANSRSGFVPGEGSGFCLLMAERIRTKLSLKALAQVLSVATDRDTKLIKTSDICLGEGLTVAVQDAISGLSPPVEKIINEIICDINGERYRSEEWGFACLRLTKYFDDPTAYQSPAGCWGDLGAASGPLFAMLACQAADRGYAKGHRTLLWASSEGGLRAAAVLNTENTGKNDRRGNGHV